MLLGVDTGGTFTDFVLDDGEGIAVHKVLSTPDDPSRAVLAGLRDLGLEEAARRGAVRITHGSTVATNATLTGSGAATAYVTNAGFTDVLRIARQARASLYDLTPEATPDPVPESLCFGVDARLDAAGNELAPLTEAAIESVRARIRARGCEAVAINLLYSFLDDRHERGLEAALEDLAFVSRSSFVLPEHGEYERGIATYLNARLGPLVGRYLTRLAAALAPSPLAVMHSAGGTMAAQVAARRSVNLLLSGPAGGLAAAAHLGRELGIGDLMTFDMGGTSTDVSLVREGRATLTSDARVGPWPVAVPMADIHTIGAGGGSIARLDAGGALTVGPASAGASPGPACYGRGGREPTVTDAHVVLGRMPEAVTLGGTLTLDRGAARGAFGDLAGALGGSIEDAAAGVIRIANEHMARALRVISLERGHDPRRLTLVSFGGAGGLHVCDLAESLSVPRVLIPANAGVLSAYGMLVAPPTRALSRTVNLPLDASRDGTIAAAFDTLERAGLDELAAEGHGYSELAVARSADLRYRGQTFTLNLDWSGIDETREAFHAAHEHRYGHRFGLTVELVNVRAEIVADLAAPAMPSLEKAPRAAAPIARAAVHGIGAVPVHRRSGLSPGDVLDGPVVLLEPVATSYLAPGWRLEVNGQGHLLLERR